MERGPQLLALVEDAFSRQADGLQDRWLISLSKPNENDKHLLMTLAGEQGKCGEKKPSHDGGMYLRDFQIELFSPVGRSFVLIGLEGWRGTEVVKLFLHICLLACLSPLA